MGARRRRPTGAPRVRALDEWRCVVSSEGHADRTEDLIVRLLQSLGSRKEVESYLKLFTSSQKFAVIKVSGGVVATELDALASSIAFLDKVGLTPVVLHGAGPQLKAALDEAGVPSTNDAGERLVTEKGIEIARRVFQRENLRLRAA